MRAMWLPRTYWQACIGLVWPRSRQELFSPDEDVVPADDNFFPVLMYKYDRADVWIDYYLYKSL